MFSTHSVYAWWLGLKLAFNTWWNLYLRTGNREEDIHSNDEQT